MYNGEDYVVVHKPPGVQVAATVDNLLENVLFCTAQVSQTAPVELTCSYPKMSSAGKEADITDAHIACRNSPYNFGICAVSCCCRHCSVRSLS